MQLHGQFMSTFKQVGGLKSKVLHLVHSEASDLDFFFFKSLVYNNNFQTTLRTNAFLDQVSMPAGPPVQ